MEKGTEPKRQEFEGLGERQEKPEGGNAQSAKYSSRGCKGQAKVGGWGQRSSKKESSSGGEWLIVEARAYTLSPQDEGLRGMLS